MVSLSFNVDYFSSNIKNVMILFSLQEYIMIARSTLICKDSEKTKLKFWRHEDAWKESNIVMFNLYSIWY